MRRQRIDDLRTAIDCLPEDTRVAMLDGIRSSPIIAGAYTTRDGGVCPMLAAHRAGGRTNLLAFARAWDRFAEAKKARPATEREVRVLVSHLEASLLMQDAAVVQTDLTDAIAEHRGLVARRRRREGPRREGAAMRRPPVHARPAGLGWLRPFRRAREDVPA